MSAYVDALSFQLYPPAAGTPETSMTLLAAVRAILRKERVSKPIWNTEANYGLLGGGRAARTISVARQIGNVMRTYVLNAQNRVARVYWYSWDLLRLSNTALVAGDRVTLTAAGRAFGTTRTWLLGTRPAGCTRSKVNTWTCTFTTATQSAGSCGTRRRRGRSWSLPGRPRPPGTRPLRRGQPAAGSLWASYRSC